MNEYLIIAGKTILFYAVLIITLRIMGKREVGELSIFDLVVFFVISEILSISIENADDSPFKTLLPIILLVIMQKLIAYIVLKFKNVRYIIEGKQVYIIREGIIDQQAMKSNRYNIDDLMHQLREKDVDSPSKVKFAILENDGTLSVILKDNSRVQHPDPIIIDGEIEAEVLKQMNKTKLWLIEELKRNGIDNYEDVFLCLLENEGLYIVRKQLS